MANNSSLLRILSFFSVLSVFQIATIPAMSYDEPKFTVVSERQKYEVRLYDNRTVAEVTFDKDNSGF
jgi:hypothetical protein